MEKSKAEKSPWVKKTKQKNRPKEGIKIFILSSKEKNLAERRLVWPNAFNNLGILWRLCPILCGHTVLNSTERDKNMLHCDVFLEKS